MKYVAILAAAFGLVLAGCNTVKGVGQDVSKAGDKLEQAADNTGGTTN